MILLRCPQCGTQQAEVIATSQVGCTVCYEVFGVILGPLIWNHQGSTTYQGKIPAARSAYGSPRVPWFKGAIEQARQEGRPDDAELLCELLELLETEPE